MDQGLLSNCISTDLLQEERFVQREGRNPTSPQALKNQKNQVCKCFILNEMFDSLQCATVRRIVTTPTCPSWLHLRGYRPEHAQETARLALLAALKKQIAQAVRVLQQVFARLLDGGDPRLLVRV